MYSVQKLAKMYNTTRQTIYTKLEHENIKPFVIIDEKGKKLLPDGINALNSLLSDSKVNIQKDTNLDNSVTSYIDKYIDDLKSQIERLENDKQRLYFELEQQRKVFLLAAPPPKKGFIAKLFKK